MAYINWNILSQCEAPFKGQNSDALNDQGPLKLKGSLKLKDDHELKQAKP